MKNFLSIFQAACILKRCLFAVVLLINVAYGATDLSRAENYFPGGKYQLFSYPDRGSVTNVVNNIHKRVINDEAIGPIHYQHVFYNGTLTYDRRFSGHPWWDHDYGPLGATTQEIDPFNGGIGFKGGIDVIKAKITAEIYHPADAYDGEQGGGLPPPSDKGARDEYTYSVTGKVRSVDIQPLDISKTFKDIVNRINDAYNSGAYADGENRQPEDNSADNDRRRDLHSDGQPENGQPEKADNGSWEVKPPVDVATAEGATDAGGWLSDLLGSLASRGRYQDTVDRSKANAALGDLKSIDNLEATGDLTAAEAKALRDGFSNKRILNNGDVTVGGYKNISLDVEKGGSGKVNIHLSPQYVYFVCQFQFWF